MTNYYHIIYTQKDAWLLFNIQIKPKEKFSELLILFQDEVLLVVRWNPKLAATTFAGKISTMTTWWWSNITGV